jgi:carboxylesterase
LDKHIILAVHGYSAPLLSGKNLQTGQLRLLPIEFRRFYWMVTEETMSRLKLPHGKTGAPPKREYEKLEALGYTKISIVGSSTGGTLLLEFVQVILIHIYIQQICS